MKFLPDTTQTSLSTLLQKLEDCRFLGLENVGFVKKKQGEKVYWYCQYTDISGIRKQRFVGPDNLKTRSLIEASKIAEDSSVDRKRLVAIIAAGGGAVEKGRPAKIIEKLAGAGVFDAGGMLIGSYAFSCYGNMLGVVFDDAMRRTEDMDVAYDRSIEIGFIRDVKSEIHIAAPEMVEPEQINPWVPPYEMIAPDGFKIEFLTARTGPHDKAPIQVERFGVNAQPLEFLDYIIENPVKSAVLYGAGILVNVPDPARYAIHKLAVSQWRPATKPEKKRKDLQQAEALIEYFLDENPGALILASDAAKQRGDMFYSFIEKGIADVKNIAIGERFIAECWNVSKKVVKPKFS